MNKKSALIIVSILISSLLILIALNEVFLYVPQLRLGIYKKVYQKEDFPSTGDFDLSEDEKTIILSCLFEYNHNNTICFNKKEKDFIELEVDSIIAKIDPKFQTIDLKEKLKVVSIDLNKNNVETINNENIPIKLIETLRDLNPEDYVSGTDLETNEKYLDFYDYINTKTTLIKYYTDEGQTEKKDSVIEEMKRFITNSYDEGYMFLYPANAEDIQYLKKLDTDLADMIIETSDIKMEDMYQDLLYIVSEKPQNYISIDEIILVNYIKLYKMQRFVGSDKKLLEKYSSGLDQYKKFLSDSIEEPNEKAEMLIEYFPTVNLMIQDYLYKTYKQNQEIFFDELLPVIYFTYPYSNMLRLNKYVIPNILESLNVL